MVRLATSVERSPEAARRLGIDGADAYRMLFAGELGGGPGKDGMVYFDEASIEAYLERHGFGVVAEPCGCRKPIRAVQAAIRYS